MNDTEIPMPEKTRRYIDHTRHNEIIDVNLDTGMVTHISDPSDIKPALTAEEWRKWLATPPGGEPKWTPQEWMREGRELHPRAALALHGQPFGFTHEDEDRLTYWVDFLEPNCTPEEHAALRSVVAKVRALLPPRE